MSALPIGTDCVRVVLAWRIVDNVRGVHFRANCGRIAVVVVVVVVDVVVDVEFVAVLAYFLVIHQAHLVNMTMSRMSGHLFA